METFIWIVCGVPVVMLIVGIVTLCIEFNDRRRDRHFDQRLADRKKVAAVRDSLYKVYVKLANDANLYTSTFQASKAISDDVILGREMGLYSTAEDRAHMFARSAIRDGFQITDGNVYIPAHLVISARVEKVS